jgi:hypothetical protein
MLKYHNEAMTVKQIAKYLVADYGIGLGDYLYQILTEDTNMDVDYKRIEEAYKLQCERVKKFLNI